MARQINVSMIEFVDQNTNASLLRITNPEKVNELFQNSDFIQALYENNENPTVTIPIDPQTQHGMILLHYFSNGKIARTEDSTLYDLTPKSRHPTLVSFEDIAHAFEYLQLPVPYIQSIIDNWDSNAIPYEENLGEDFDTWANRQLNIRQKWKNRYVPTKPGGKSKYAINMNNRTKDIEANIKQQENYINRVERATSGYTSRYRGMEYPDTNLSRNYRHLEELREKLYNTGEDENYPFPQETMNMSNTEFDKWLRIQNPLEPLPVQNHVIKNEFGLRNLFKNKEGGRRRKTHRRRKTSRKIRR